MYKSVDVDYNIQQIKAARIIELYNVSADYLLGLTDVPEPYPRTQPPMLEESTNQAK